MMHIHTAEFSRLFDQLISLLFRGKSADEGSYYPRCYTHNLV